MKGLEARRNVVSLIFVTLMAVAGAPEAAKPPSAEIEAAKPPSAEIEAAKPAPPEPESSVVGPNDNLRPAGALAQGTLTLSLRAGIGQWKPEGPKGPALRIEALGEAGSVLTVPAPLIRVPEGTRIVASVRNDLEVNLTVHGLCARDGTACPTLEVLPGETCEVRFTSGRAGTYHYWASAMGAPVPFRELGGAFIVDPPGGAVEPDRILVITEWTSLTPAQLRAILGADDASKAFLASHPRYTFTINGLSWPATERLTYQLGERVRWRIINLSSQTHPMHLHGFYFDVNSLGNGMRDQPSEASRQRQVVTQLVPSGGTMTMTWTPERVGNWLLHCHIMAHVSLDRRLETHDGPHGGHSSEPSPESHDRHAGSAGMAGMIVGITVLGTAPESRESTRPKEVSPRKLTLVMQPGAERDGHSTAGFFLSEGIAPMSTGQVTVPGPPIVLRRNEPVEITLVNHLTEATAIHWHGLELDSYYDGVHGWSGIGQRLAPMIAPGESFVVRFTPPRAGTFIYHTHLHDFRQLSSGLYGPLIVTEPGEAFDEAVDHVIVIGRTGVTSEEPAVLSDPASVILNGERAPRFAWKAGQRHRIRLINITPDDIFTVALQASDGPVMWKPLTKDGARVPAVEGVLVAARQTIAVGETYDFEYEAPPGRKTAWLEVRTTSGKWLVQGQITIR
jgi:FtsP/CotA-like multicopper oxidase with cupredoxin domain